MWKFEVFGGKNFSNLHWGWINVGGFEDAEVIIEFIGEIVTPSSEVLSWENIFKFKFCSIFEFVIDILEGLFWLAYILIIFAFELILIILFMLLIVRGIFEELLNWIFFDGQ